MSKWVQVETVALIGGAGGVAVGFAVSLTEKKNSECRAYMATSL